MKINLSETLWKFGGRSKLYNFSLFLIIIALAVVYTLWDNGVFPCLLRKTFCLGNMKPRHITAAASTSPVHSTPLSWWDTSFNDNIVFHCWSGPIDIHGPTSENCQFLNLGFVVAFWFFNFFFLSIVDIKDWILGFLFFPPFLLVYKAIQILLTHLGFFASNPVLLLKNNKKKLIPSS